MRRHKRCMRPRDGRDKQTSTSTISLSILRNHRVKRRRAKRDRGLLALSFPEAVELDVYASTDGKLSRREERPQQETGEGDPRPTQRAGKECTDTMVMNLWIGKGIQ